MRGSAVLVAAGAALLLTACASGGAAPDAGELTVFAAASLTETFTELGERFEAEHPGVAVRFNFGASSDLAQQIASGAPADVFAAASEATMKTVTDAGAAAGTPTVFATNVLRIATAPGNPKGIATFADLARPDLKVVVCAPQVPCGATAEKIEEATGVMLSPVSEEPDVKSALGKVTSGDADAGLVFVTDVTDVTGAGADVQGVPFPEAAQAVTDYPIVVLEDAPQAGLAAEFQDLVTGERGREALSAAGFGTP
ncbi:molybdate ABC transporter substrate-binding protein [Pseudonocardia humida]|uniref:Molybdate ABC transporter substrate-binding protein n=1 Tax=Pseudonocardia humida TaxID=2800819 RepID=A0ABT1A1D7_9PSEU|nr:molybdate ABC transporter substrate-binding protein [Pseudonocardia humida]MCO1656821.1 molybdate ABC transporter substrate-binding protein [Pseudonocardia humida]